jgi:hypothetical protein
MHAALPPTPNQAWYMHAALPPTPNQAWYMQHVFAILVGGVLPFGAVFIELFFILSSIWLHQVSYPYPYPYPHP